MRRESRRQFLGRSAALATAAALAAGRLRTFAAGPRLMFPAAPRARLAVASYPFRAYIESPRNKHRDPTKPGMKLEDFAAMVARQFGVRNIEPLGDHFESMDPGYVRELRRAVEKADSHIVDIPVGAKASFYDPNPARREEAVADAKKWIDVAVAAGSPSIRTHIAGARGVEPDADRAAESLGHLAEYGAGQNVLVNLENDNLVTEDAFFIVKIIDRVQNPYLRALPDFCNSALNGEPDFNYDALAVMFRHAYSIAHMKDSEAGEGGKIYTVDVGRAFRIAKASGYRGYFSMEWDRPGDPYQGTHRLVAESLKNLA